MSTHAEQRDWLGGAIATTGGAALVTGALLPWMSLFAGLQPYPGVTGLYGRMLLVGGAFAVCCGIAMVVRARPWLRTAVGALGIVLAAFAAWVLHGLHVTTHALEHDPLLVARPGPGVFVALTGALIVALLVVPLPHRARTRD